MAVGSVTANSGTAELDGANTVERLVGKQLGQKEFLNLLITQLTNQDPLNPQDDKEFISQMAQFSALEGTKEMNDSIGRMQGAAMVGKVVDATYNQDGIAANISGPVTAIYYRPEGTRAVVQGKEVKLSDITSIKAG
jgi:flagellar basal-body rod modification protein FlgD